MGVRDNVKGCRKISTPLECYPRAVLPVTSFYTDFIIPEIKVIDLHTSIFAFPVIDGKGGGTTKVYLRKHRIISLR
jgi:hypothetical protein